MDVIYYKRSIVLLVQAQRSLDRCRSCSHHTKIPNEKEALLAFVQAYLAKEDN